MHGNNRRSSIRLPVTATHEADLKKRLELADFMKISTRPVHVVARRVFHEADGTVAHDNDINCEPHEEPSPSRVAAHHRLRAIKKATRAAGHAGVKRARRDGAWAVI
ncbi:hypothetical protein Dimus_020991 [Dionaea muscipula]